MGTCPTKQVQISDIQILKPKWACAVSVRDNYLLDKIADYTSGFRAINNNTIELSQTRSYRIEGARWSRGFTSGKHVIEFIYPVHIRGAGARVGLGPQDAPLGGKRAKDVVGGINSLALDLNKNRTLQHGSTIGPYPPEKRVLPDWFFMYIDLDNGAVHFGSDGEYYGTAFTDVKVTAGTCLYPMVTASCEGAVISIVYRGQGKEVDGPLRKKRNLRDVMKGSHARACKRT